MRSFIKLALILLAAFAFMWQSSARESATMDELAHIPAGYSYVKYLDYRLNPEHPPLLKALAGLPILALDVYFPTDHSSWLKDINGQWEAGAQFLYKYGNNADQIISMTRIAPILFSLIAIILIYVWSRKLLGRSWAFLPAFLFAFSPTLLSHGHYVTTDVAAALGVLAATYPFLKFLRHRSSRYLILSGLGLGIAELAKFSNALLIPYFLLLIVIYSSSRLLGRGYFWHYLKSFLLVLLIAYLMVYAAYFVLTLNYPQEKQFADAENILASFSPRWPANLNLTLIDSAAFRPLGEYMLGLLMVLQRAAGGNTAYFLGEVSAAGSLYYFPIVFLMKEPIPSLLLIALALVMSAKNIISTVKSEGFRTRLKNFREYLSTHFEEFSMLLFIIIYWSWSIKSPLNIGVRHLLPTLPFIYILTTAGIKKWAGAPERARENIPGKLAAAARKIAGGSLKTAFIVVVLLWYFVETASTFPNFLPYFNELAGGTANGYRFVTDSNYDWGQDLKRLSEWVNAKNNDDDNDNDVRKIAVDYFGGGNPKYYLGENIAEYWWSAKGNPKDYGIAWLAVSVNTLEGTLGKLHPGQSRKPEDEYKWLQELRPPKPGLGNVPEPDYRAGMSIFIYKL